jgi:hypothetical protein
MGDLLRRALQGSIGVLTVLLGLLVTLALAAMVVLLTAKLWHDVDPGLQRVAVKAAAAAGEPESGTVDAVTNAMTAIGVSVAVVTLVLTVGTSWMGLRQRELDVKLLELDKKLARIATREELDRLRAKVGVSGIRAKHAAFRQIVRDQTAPGLLTVHFFEVSMELDQLAHPEHEVRRRAFSKLAQRLDPEPWSEEVAELAEYFEDCHQLARASFLAQQERLDLQALADWEARGVGCRLFDRLEVKRVLGLA